MSTTLLALLLISGCGDDAAPGGGGTTPGPTPDETETPPTPPTPPVPEEPELAADLPNGLLLSYAQFELENGQVTARPGPARLEILTRSGGEWHVEVIEDPQSNVFHKAMAYDAGDGTMRILTLGGMAAAVKLWKRGPDGFVSQTLWTEEFGGRFHRMRDAEVADLYGDGQRSIAVGTHDQGVFAVLRPQANGPFTVERLDRHANTFIHEVEIGDLDGDRNLEVYTTPSEPNRLEGGAQHGEVVRYVPRTGGPNGGRTVVADLGNRHAKEILVADVDGDGRDELYVAVEALTSGPENDVQIVEPVQIRRFDHDTPATGGAVIATLNDRFTRFLTAGDIDGDGRREMVAAAFRSGLWLLRPGSDPRGEWSVENIARDSSGFEHAAAMADLDGDGTMELYVAADDQGELHRYVWVNGRPRRETIHSRDVPRAMMTWNIQPVPVSVLGAAP